MGFSFKTVLQCVVPIALAMVATVLHGASCKGPAGIAPSLTASDYDGLLLGGDGCFYDPASVRLELVPRLGSAGTPSSALMFYVNAALPDQRQAGTTGVNNSLRPLHARTGIDIVTVFFGNQGRTDSFSEISPFAETSRAVDTLVRLVLDRVGRGEETYIRSGSAGPLVVVEALRRIRLQLLRQSRRISDVDARMALIKVETFGSVAKWFPPGPRYVHYVNQRDVVPFLFGVMSPTASPGPNAVIAWFDDRVPDVKLRELGLTIPSLNRYIASAHNSPAYIAHWYPFEEIYQQRRSRLPVSLVRVP